MTMAGRRTGRGQWAFRITSDWLQLSIGTPKSLLRSHYASGTLDFRQFASVFQVQMLERLMREPRPGCGFLWSSFVELQRPDSDTTSAHPHSHLPNSISQHLRIPIFSNPVLSSSFKGLASASIEILLNTGTTDIHIHGYGKSHGFLRLEVAGSIYINDFFA